VYYSTKCVQSQYYLLRCIPDDYLGQTQHHSSISKDWSGGAGESVYFIQEKYGYNLAVMRGREE
jgi:hypothetical protein